PGHGGRGGAQALPHPLRATVRRDRGEPCEGARADERVAAEARAVRRGGRPLSQVCAGRATSPGPAFQIASPCQRAPIEATKAGTWSGTTMGRVFAVHGKSAGWPL